MLNFIHKRYYDFLIASLGIFFFNGFVRDRILCAITGIPYSDFALCTDNDKLVSFNHYRDICCYVGYFTYVVMFICSVAMLFVKPRTWVMNLIVLCTLLASGFICAVLILCQLGILPFTGMVG